MATPPEVRIIDQPKLLVSVRKAAEALDVSERIIYELCHTQELESVKIGPKKWIRRITCESLNRYVEEARNESRRRTERTAPDGRG